MKPDEWKNCYPSNWKGLIAPEAMAHPAKYSSKLIRRIYEHMLAEEWVKPGDNILDPFGGVALGALDAMRLGLNWYGVELEAKFHELGESEYPCEGFTVETWKRYYARPKMVQLWRGYRDMCPSCESAWNDIATRKIPHKEPHTFRGNIPLWNYKFRTMPNFGAAHLFCGDSRHLLEVIGGVQASVSSPPYGDEMSQNNGGNRDRVVPSIGKGGAIPPRMYGSSEGQLGAMKADGFVAALASPPYAESIQTSEKGSGIDYSKSKTGGKGRTAGRESIATGYGRGNGQLGGMKAEQFNAAISSPPFLQSEGGTPKLGGAIDAALYARHAAGNKSSHAYGESDGQLSSMKEGGFDAAISSPPFGTGDSADAQSLERRRDKSAQWLQKNTGWKTGYGDSAGQLAQTSGDDFWLAARTIVEQVYLALAPRGHAVWVVKDYVKAKKIVPFSDQWRQLCEAVGFVTIHEHHAMLVHHKGTQHTLDGGTVEHKTESKSFFRRLAEKNGSPRIDYETVFCMEKP